MASILRMGSHPKSLKTTSLYSKIAATWAIIHVIQFKPGSSSKSKLIHVLPVFLAHVHAHTYTLSVTHCLALCSLWCVIRTLNSLLAGKKVKVLKPNLKGSTSIGCAPNQPVLSPPPWRWHLDLVRGTFLAPVSQEHLEHRHGRMRQSTSRAWGRRWATESKVVGDWDPLEEMGLLWCYLLGVLLHQCFFLLNGVNV